MFRFSSLTLIIDPDFDYPKEVICFSVVSFRPRLSSPSASARTKETFANLEVEAELRKLEPSRNIIAHNNVLPPKEINRIRLCLDNLQKQLKRMPKKGRETLRRIEVTSFTLFKFVRPLNPWMRLIRTRQSNFVVREISPLSSGNGNLHSNLEFTPYHPL
jgi:hypothetical protein